MRIIQGTTRGALGRGIGLVEPAYLKPLLTLTRAQSAGVESTALGSDGTTWQTYAADVPRFNGTAQRLLIGGARTNAVRNPRAEGASGATQPTNWTQNLVAGMSATYTRTTRNGVEGVLVALTGTPSATTQQSITVDSATVTAGTTMAAAAFIELVSGSLTNFALITLRAEGSDPGTVFTPGSFARIERVFAVVGTTAVCRLRWTSADIVTPVDATIFIGFPTLEAAAFASTPILPPVDSPAVTTCGADLITATLASLAIGANGACTVLWSGMIPQAASSADQIIFQIDDGTGNNRYRVRNTGGGLTLIATQVTGGVAASSASAGSFTAGTPFAIGATIDAAGRMALSFSGAAVQATTGGPTSGLTTFRLGNNDGGTGALFGETARLSILPYALSDAALQAAVAAFPTS